MAPSEASSPVSTGALYVPKAHPLHAQTAWGCAITRKTSLLLPGETRLKSDEALSQEFFESIIDSAPTAADQKDREYLVTQLMPCLVPALTSLLRAEDDVQMRKSRGENVLSIKPLDYLAKYLYRHNPRHAEPSDETKMLQRLAKKLVG
ncbi:hypothetical protein H310_13241 [Aphanomyces invadans]|uniref:Uncharacterized protein n=1 Tax=Aphanomyces invadans TaxID=157072 RepID=A0A024TEW6_9STRA|nr:hypothetical protein H310_13241 [Aphanomyces invadans]ETV92583.1 hypothetical protein H310_13241 [Aphanomyces invadans]|eukprot:XP_008878890.1 hypothetical protein H310_13241 [Aphanomyces invadans]